MSYRDSLAIAWSISWRAGIAATLLSIPVSILLGHLTSSQWVSVIAGFFIETFAAYPVTLNHALAAHEGKERLKALARSQVDSVPRLPYGKTAAVGAVLSLISAVLSIAATFVLALAVQDPRKLQEILPPVLIGIALFRLFTVLPVFIQIVARGGFPSLFRQGASASASPVAIKNDSTSN